MRKKVEVPENSTTMRESGERARVKYERKKEKFFTLRKSVMLTLGKLIFSQHETREMMRQSLHFGIIFDFKLEILIQNSKMTRTRENLSIGS